MIGRYRAGMAFDDFAGGVDDGRGRKTLKRFERNQGYFTDLEIGKVDSHGFEEGPRLVGADLFEIDADHLGVGIIPLKDDQLGEFPHTGWTP